jgi:hypothetical protein
MRRRRCWRRVGFGLALAIAWGLIGAERARAGSLLLWGVFPPHTAREALADGYGRAIVKEFGTILLASADKACLDARGIDAARLETLGADLLARYGQKLVDMPSSIVDNETVAAEFARVAGPKAMAELRRLTTAPSVQKFRERGRPARLDRMVDLIAENLDRFLLLQRRSLARPLSPLGSASPQVLALSRIEAADAAADRFVQENKADRKLHRFLVLADQWDAAMLDALRDNPAARAMPPHGAFKGIEDELETACVKARSTGSK